MKLFLLLAGFLNLFLLFSCKKYQPAPEAFFIQAGTVSVAPETYSSQGSASHRISDLFLYVNGQFQGAYAIGKVMPIVTRGKQATINVFAGIKNNGIKDATITWLLYDPIKFDTLVAGGTTIQRPFTFRYKPAVKFVWMEDFDGQVGFSLIKSAGSDTTFKLAGPQNRFEGNSAEIGLYGPGNYKYARFESAVLYELPKNTANLYLELNYKCDVEFEVGVSDGVNPDKPALIINPKSEWNKIYIQIAEAVNRNPIADKYKIYFKIQKPNDRESAHVWLDNIKLIYL